MLYRKLLAQAHCATAGHRYFNKNLNHHVHGHVLQGAGTEQIVSAVCCLGSEEKIKMASLSNKEAVVEGMNYCDASAQLVVQERRLIEIPLRN